MMIPTKTFENLINKIINLEHIPMEPLSFCMWCYVCKKHTFLLCKGPLIGSPLLFIRGATCVKSISFC
jgi:hypothetical protein